MDRIEIVALSERVKNGFLISEKDALCLAKAKDKDVLYDCANEIRKHFCGSVMDLCSITNAKSGKCSENCAWCSQSAYHQSKIDIYPLVERQRAVREALESARQGVGRHSLVTSGKRIRMEELEPFLEIFREIQNNCSIGLCASMGLLSRDALQRLKDVGITKYHCNLETAPSFFAKVCSTHSLDEKIQTIRDAQAIGLEVCSGGIIGLGESMAERVELALLLRELGILSIPINILNPIAGTALEAMTPLSEDEVLTTIALFRFINPRAYLRFAGGRLLIRAYQARALNAGINASIVGDMLTTVGSGIAEDLRDFAEAGLTVPSGEATRS
jgi:adenosylmethionine-8-amino-7-oxononanoate aminotransferase/biotin synthase